MKFDKLYVLAKGGICIYEGPPRSLTTHLSAAGVVLNRDQVPIEVLIKISSRSSERDDEKVKKMCDIMSSNRRALESRCERQGKIANGISQKGVKYNISCHMWYLMMRSIIYSLRHRVFTILFQLTLIIGLAFILTNLFNKHIGEPDGCLPIDANKTCNETDDSMRAEKWMLQNQRLHFFALLAIQFLITVPTVLVFTNEVKLFYNEHKNGIIKYLLIPITLYPIFQHGTAPGHTTGLKQLLSCRCVCCLHLFTHTLFTPLIISSVKTIG
jgi:hypothetical protein